MAYTRSESQTLQQILQELSQLDQAGDIPRRIVLSRQALEMLSRKEQPELWAFLQVELANILVQSPLGDRSESIDLAIGHYQQALQVYTRAAFPEEWANIQNNLGNANTNRILGERAENLERAIQALPASAGDSYSRSLR